MRKFVILLCLVTVAFTSVRAAPKAGAKKKGGGAAKAKKKPPAKKRPARPKKPSGGAKPRSTPGFSDEAVEKAINKGVRYLFSQMKGDHWPGRMGGHNKYPLGPSAIACYALLEADVSPQDKRLEKALLYLAKGKTDRTYTVALRANVWLCANRHTDGKYHKLLIADAKRLWMSCYRGTHNYPCLGKPDPSRYDNSCSQFGVLGVWAAARDRVEIPPGYWAAVMRHWAGDQNPDGGWPYRADKGAKAKQSGSRGTMTVGGVATMFVCVDNLYSDKFIQCNRGLEVKPIEKGLAWLEKNFAKGGGGNLFYYLYGAERVGLASGYKTFGKTDWYKHGARLLIRSQAGNGSWGNSIPNTAFSLLFLVRGRNAVVFNKLEFNGDWNNRPRDLASLTRWMSEKFERTVNWQIVNLNVPVTEWHDAPILYISASAAPKFTKANLEKIRTFVHQGGMIFSVSECGGRAGFREGIRKIYKELFPDYELKPIARDHEIYTRKVHFDLPGGRPAFEILSNGVRPLAVHTDMDLSLAWQTRKYVTQKYAFEGAVNVVRYMTGGITSLRARGTTLWPPAGGGKGKRTIALARIKHNANCNPEPLAYQRFKRLLAEDAQVTLNVSGPMPIGRLKQSGAKIATMTGTGKLTLTEAEVRQLKQFVEDGGTLVVDAAGGNSEFATSARAILRQAFGAIRIRPLAASAPMFHVRGHEIAKVTYRPQTRLRLGQPTTAVLQAVLIGNKRRAGVYFSKEDLTAGLVGYDCHTIDGYSADSAYEIMRNIVLSAGK